MKKLLIMAGALLLVAALVLYRIYLSEKPQFPPGTIFTSLYSHVLQEERAVIVHLPANYHPDRQYPVIYALDGSSLDLHLIAALKAQPHLPECVVVGLPNVSGQGRQRDYTPPFMRTDADEADSPMGQGDAFLDFLTDELIPFIEKNYAVGAARTLCGQSRGGLLVVYSLLYRPDVFTGRMAFSPALWRDDQLILKVISESMQPPHSPSFLYLSLGMEENEKMKTAFGSFEAFLQQTKPERLHVDVEYTPHADHQSNSALSASSALVRWQSFLK